MMKRIIAMLIACVLLVGTAAFALAEGSDPSAFLSILTDSKTNWNFTDEPVDENDLRIRRTLLRLIRNEKSCLSGILKLS